MNKLKLLVVLTFFGLLETSFCYKMCSIVQANSTHISENCTEIDHDQRKYGSNLSMDHCGVCDHLVSWTERGVACETCGKWYHAGCQSIGTKSYQDLEDSNVLWFCEICKHNNYSTTMFDLHNVGQLSNEMNSNDTSFTTCSDFNPNHCSTPTTTSKRDKHRGRPLRFINVNFQGLFGKRAETCELLERTKPDILIGSETWLKPEVNDNELSFTGYNIFRKDRASNQRGGGVLIAVKQDLQCMQVDSLGTDCEILWVKILTKTQKPIYICAFYRPDVSDSKGLVEFEHSLRKATEMKDAKIVIGGDFNLPNWDWQDMKLKNTKVYTKMHSDFVDLLYDVGVSQMVSKPTRHNPDNTLDLVITNTPDLIPRIEIIPGLSDHEIVFFEYSVQPDRKKNAPRQILLYNKANWTVIKEELTKLQDKMQEILDSEDRDDVEKLWETFKETLLDNISKNIPKKTTKERDSYPWITKEIKRLIHKRDRLSKKKKKTGSKDIALKYLDTRREVRRKIRQEHWKYICNLFEQNEKEVNDRPCLKRFWTYVKHQRSSSCGVSPLRNDGKLVTDSKQKAEILNNQFFKAFSDGATFSAEEFMENCNMNTKRNANIMPEIEITVKGVEKLLSGLNPNKATGPDGISPRILKELSLEIAPLLTMIYKASLRTGIVPLDWRQAFVTPVFKKGEKYDPINYRPVSLTSVPCKILEHIVVSNMMTFFEDNKILCNQQHGFRKGRSCESQLLEFVEEVSVGLEEGITTDVVVMDFAKAFDRVNHSLLTHKLAQYGVQGLVNNWISNFLAERSQCVVVEGERSGPISVRSGVPQGSVLGPCLFLAYINDLPDRVSSVSRLFADDTLLHRLMKSIQDHQAIQEDLKELEKWEEEWKMDFHPKKCNVLPISRSTKKTISTCENYILHNETLEQVTETKYLGVTLQSNLSWDKHINTICTKANKMLGLLRRNLKTAPAKTKELGYKALVRPVLEYASSVWDPHCKKDIDKIEKIQRRAARFVLNRYKKVDSVSSMLKDLKWETLEKRRKKARLTMFYKIHNGQVHARFNKMNKLKERSGRRGHSEMYERITNRTKYRDNTFLPRTIREWNSLPQSTIQAPSAGSFSLRMASSLM